MLKIGAAHPVPAGFQNDKQNPTFANLQTKNNVEN